MMKFAALHKNLRLILLLAMVFMAAQSLLALHDHDDGALTENGCQLCLFAHQHSPAPVNYHNPVLLILTHFVIPTPTQVGTVTPRYYLFSPSRAPPADLS